MIVFYPLASSSVSSCHLKKVFDALLRFGVQQKTKLYKVLSKYALDSVFQEIAISFFQEGGRKLTLKFDLYFH